MFFEDMTGKEFNNISQRVIYPYIITYPEFIPVTNCDASEASQMATHLLIKDSLIKIYNSPEIIGMQTDKDEYFNGEAFKDKPELNGLLLNLEKKLLGFFNMLYEIGINGEVNGERLFISKDRKLLNKAKLTLLTEFGFITEIVNGGIYISSDKYRNLCNGLHVLSVTCRREAGREVEKPVCRQSKTKLLFMKCIYDINSLSFTRLYEGLFGNKINVLEKYLLGKGFYYKFADADLSLVKMYSKNQESYFEIKFNWRHKNQIQCNLKLQGFTKMVTNHFNEINDELKGFVYYRLKNCDNCGYCTQTDKKCRNPLTVRLTYNGETIDKCPLYPYLTWDKPDENATTVIMELIEFSEKDITN